MNMQLLTQAKPAAKSVISPVRGNLVLQRRATDRDPITAVPPIVQDVLDSPGQPLDPATRAFIEPRFGHDFGHVRVHTNAKAADSARAVHAHAYTVGSNVVFGANEFAPATHHGRELLAHELAHTIQQRSRGAPSPSSDPSEIFESSANAAARSVASGGNVSPSLPACGQQIQRSPDGDPRWKNNVRAARYRGEVMANRIKKHGILSREARAKINQELAYFEGDAKEAYLRKVKPVLFQTVPIEMPAERVERKVPQPSITWSLVQPDPNRISDEQIYAPVTEAKRKEAEAKRTGPEYARRVNTKPKWPTCKRNWKRNQSTLSRRLNRRGCVPITSPRGRANWSGSEPAALQLRKQVWHMTPKEISRAMGTGQGGLRCGGPSSPSSQAKAASRFTRSGYASGTIDIKHGEENIESGSQKGESARSRIHSRRSMTARL